MLMHVNTSERFNKFYIYSYAILVSFIALTGTYFAITRNPYSFSWLIPTVINLALAGYVYLENSERKINKVFAIMSVCISIWTLDVYGFYIIRSESFVKLWIKILRIGYLFASASIFHFMVLISETALSRSKKYINISYAISILFTVANILGYFENEVLRNQWGYFPKIGNVYRVSLLNLMFWIFFGLYYVYYAYRNIPSLTKKNQMKYVFASIFTIFFIGAVSNTLYGLGFKVYPMGGFAATAYVGILAYAIIVHRLLDIRVIIRKSAIYASLTLSIAAIYAVIVGVFTAVFGKENLSGINSWLINGFSGALIATLFLPLRTKIQNIIDRIFFKDKYNYRETLRALSSDLASTLELDKLLNTMINKLTDAMHISMACILIFNQEKQKYYIKVSKGLDPGAFEISENDEIVSRIKRKHSVLTISRDIKEETELSKRGFSVVSPFIKDNMLLGIFALGPKMSDDMYTQEDIELLLTVSNQASIAIENARLNTELRGMEKNLLETDKLAALGTFASSIAHEVKNPLASIKTFCQLMISRYKDKEFIDKFNKIVPDEIVRMENVLSELLDFNKFSEKEHALVYIDKILDGLVSLLDFEAFNKNISIVKKYDGEKFAVNGSEKELKQVFMNLIINAMQSMPDGGEAGVKIKEDRQNIVVEVSDTGKGMNKETVKKLFVPFFTTKPKGTGLGLSITKKIVSGHYGNIEVESTPGRGSKFIVFLPKAVVE